MRQLLVASVLIVLAAASAPSFLQQLAGRAGSPESVAASEQGSSREERANRSPTGQLQIKAERDGHFYVEAEINLRPVRLMVDTGASVVALRQSDAHAIGIRPRPADFERPVQTANGTAFGADAELDSVAVDGVEVSGVRALILPDEQLSVSLLGASFLNRLQRFEVSDGTLIFEN